MEEVGKVGINTTQPQFTLDVHGDMRISDNLHLNGIIDTSNVIIENIAEWTGTVHLEDNVWKVDTIHGSLISPSSVTLVSTGVFRISFTGATLPIKSDDSTFLGSQRYFITGTAGQGFAITNRTLAWQANSIEYFVRAISNNSSANIPSRINVKILLEDN